MEEFNIVFPVADSIPAKTLVEFIRVKLSESLADDLKLFIASSSVLESINAKFKALKVLRRDQRSGDIRVFKKESVVRFIDSHLRGDLSNSTVVSSDAIETGMSQISKCLDACDKMLASLAADFGSATSSPIEDEGSDIDLDHANPVNLKLYVSRISGVRTRCDKLLVEISTTRNKRALSPQAEATAQGLLTSLGELKWFGRRYLDSTLEDLSVSISAGKSDKYSEILASVKDVQRIERRVKAVLKLYASQGDDEEGIDIDANDVSIVDHAPGPTADGRLESLCSIAVTVFPSLSEQRLKSKVVEIQNLPSVQSLTTQVSTEDLNTFIKTLMSDATESTLSEKECLTLLFSTCLKSMGSAVLGETIDALLKDYGSVAAVTMLLSVAPELEDSRDVFLWLLHAQQSVNVSTDLLSERGGKLRFG
jgi:hypothetical protein